MVKQQKFEHISVLLNETVDYLNCKSNSIILDGTLGGGGHSFEILNRIQPNGHLIGIDQDPAAIQAATEKLKLFNGKFTLVHNNFSDMQEALTQTAYSKVDGIVLDIGVSSHQFDTDYRGFSYKYDAPLDMRMNPEATITAADIVNDRSEQEIADIIKNYGEERWAARIAKFIVMERPIKTTFELVSVIKKAIPAAARKDGPHPARKTFQALRIEVNQELEVLKQGIQQGVEILHKGGRFCIITFHSLEDRIVKNEFRRLQNPCTCPSDFPVCVCNKEPKIKIITRRPVTPSDEECEQNNRARSAKLRVCEKI
jgi:16S rRNA (cytosine1402-N4)-methyltransferase